MKFIETAREEIRVLPAREAIDVSAGDTSELVFDTQVHFKPVALRITHRSAHVLLVRRLQVGNLLLLLADGDLGAEAFCERRRGKMVLEIQWPTIAAGGQARVTLYNPMLAAERAVAAFMVGIVTPPFR